MRSGPTVRVGFVDAPEIALPPNPAEAMYAPIPAQRRPGPAQVRPPNSTIPAMLEEDPHLSAEALITAKVTAS